MGHTLCHTLSATTKKSGRRFMISFLEKLDSLDTSPIRGEYKLWILRRFLIPLFHFILSVDVILDSSIKKVQSQCTRKIKSWLGLTKGVTNAVIHHPNVIDIPTISEYRTKTKLTFLSSIVTSEDPMITEISDLLLDQDFNTYPLRLIRFWFWQRTPYPLLLPNLCYVNVQVFIGRVMSNIGMTNLVN